MTYHKASSQRTNRFGETALFRPLPHRDGFEEVLVSVSDLSIVIQIISQSNPVSSLKKASSSVSWLLGCLSVLWLQSRH